MLPPAQNSWDALLRPFDVNSLNVAAAGGSGSSGGSGGGGKSHDWVENTDPGSGRKYYYNEKTKESRWERSRLFFSLPLAPSSPLVPTRSLSMTLGAYSTDQIPSHAVLPPLYSVPFPLLMRSTLPCRQSLSLSTPHSISLSFLLSSAPRPCALHSTDPRKWMPQRREVPRTRRASGVARPKAAPVHVTPSPPT